VLTENLKRDLKCKQFPQKINKVTVLLNIKLNLIKVNMAVNPHQKSPLGLVGDSFLGDGPYFGYFLLKQFLVFL